MGPHSDTADTIRVRVEVSTRVWKAFLKKTMTHGQSFVVDSDVGPTLYRAFELTRLAARSLSVPRGVSAGLGSTPSSSVKKDVTSALGSSKPSTENEIPEKMHRDVRRQAGTTK